MYLKNSRFDIYPSPELKESDNASSSKHNRSNAATMGRSGNYTGRALPAQLSAAGFPSVIQRNNEPENVPAEQSDPEFTAGPGVAGQTVIEIDPDEAHKLVGNYLHDHAGDLLGWMLPANHPSHKGALPKIDPPPKGGNVLMSSTTYSSPAQQAPVQRVVAPANHDGPFAVNAVNIPTGAPLPGMGAPGYGGTSINNTGQAGDRTGINNAAYGSGVGGHRPTNWVTFENLTGGNPWKQLHLLNDNLGGLGQASNLAPGSTSFNSNHLHGAEAPVKNWAGCHGIATAAARAATYSVGANYGNPNGVQLEVDAFYDDTFNYNLRLNNAVAAALPGLTLMFTNQRKQFYTNNVFPGLHAQYLLDLAAHNNNPLLNPLPAAPLLPMFYAHLPTMMEMAMLQNMLINHFANLLNAQVTGDKNWLQTYVMNTFPSSFACTATFYDENPPATVVRSAPQTVTIAYN